MKKILYILSFTSIITSTLFSQNFKRVNIWYFGESVGIDFNNQPPLPLNDSELDIAEGCSTMSDTTGQLMIYTDGIKIWNKNHELMPGADDLGGNNSSTQSGLIVPLPASDSLLYVFSIGSYPISDGLQYSIVDITLNNGLGGLIASNISLSEECRERIIAILHCNKKDYWIISHERENNTFLVWLLTEFGISNLPIEIQIGTSQSTTATSAIGHLKSSIDGSRIALASYGDDFFEVYDFNNATGAITNPIKLTHPEFDKPFGVEFSPNGKLLYLAGVQTVPILFQANLDLPSVQEIQNSIQIIGQTVGQYFGAMQYAPDGKIYIARNNRPFLAVIQNPNELGAECNFVDGGFQLNAERSRAGLPNLISSYFHEFPVVNLTLENDTFCVTDTNILLSGGFPEGGQYSGSGVNGNIFEPNLAGVGSHFIFYSIQSENGCIYTDSVKVIVLDIHDCITAETSPIKNHKDIKIIPNPSKGEFIIDTDNWVGEKTIRIYNTIGQIIYSDKIDSNLINIENIPNGNYLLEISNSEYSSTKRLIIH